MITNKVEHKIGNIYAQVAAFNNETHILDLTNAFGIETLEKVRDFSENTGHYEGVAYAVKTQKDIDTLNAGGIPSNSIELSTF